MGKISFCKLTSAQYSGITEPDPETVFFLSDIKVLMLDGAEYTHVKGERFSANRPFTDDIYGPVAKLDEQNAIELSGYYAEPVTRFDLWLVSATPEVSGNVVLNVGTESFIVTVTDVLSKVRLVLTNGVRGKITVSRDTASPSDTLPGTVLFVDGRCC